jgi:3-keto-5-aminohexanoate cleavage enzyme
MNNTKKTLIIVAPNGARKTKADHPNLPICPEEIANEVAACVEAGAGMVHLHARTAQGKHSLDILDNATVLKTVKDKLGDKVIIQLTTEAVGMYQPSQQMALIQSLKPEAASFALSELIPDPSYEKKASLFFHWAAENKILTQYIIYSPEQLAYYLDLRERKLLPSHHHHLLLVLGRYHAKQQSEPEDLTPFLPLIKQLDVRWAVCAFGKKELDCLLAAAELGGDVRIGFENNMHTRSGELAINNAAQVKILANDLNEKFALTPMNASTFRQCF